MRPMNSSKNKLNSKLILNFNPKHNLNLLVDKEVEVEQQKYKKEWGYVCGYTNEREEKSGIRVWRRKNQEGKKKKENEDREEKSGYVCEGEKTKRKKGKKKEKGKTKSF